MTTAGWILFSTFWGLVLGLNAYCFGKILKHRHKHGRE